MQFSQIFLMSLQSLKNNRLRTSLTILGVVVGIFSIIVIMTILTMLQTSIEEGVSFLSKNTFQIQKFPPIRTGGHGEWEKYRNRKDITLEDFFRLQEMLPQAKYVAADQGMGGRVIKYRSKETNPNIYATGVTAAVMQTSNLTIKEGRGIQETDVDYSRNVCVLGPDVEEKLFAGIDPIDKKIRLDNVELQVVGIFEKQPGMFGQSFDTYVALPLTTFQSIYGKRTRSVDITVMSHSEEDYDEVIEAAIGAMRTIRKVEPGAENDFNIFSNESLMGQINDITGGVKIGAMVVSIIALIAAGVGIMNIMLVSVTERTKEIGIRKAIGARKKTILMQFLIEAVVLCLMGGFIGILLGVGVGNLAGAALNAPAAVPIDWVLIGLFLCVLVGVIFGTYPAFKAANLDPIEALRYE
ncbi:MAG: peptide ABC transporter permease [Ignavibacteria bacterium CG2_30_36_16]|jgi:putative ABC transport system permease protein|nr:FtsX-like permease family protein [Ignavibacteria bacterium]OIP55811.1 MAG: peptide ABC transporter permease [Ignavibacteria bacterium CG2_30_36_16]PJA98924.1 MAG: peptide ABC transporter permease [Ignavibacteria bacterium CG_4_9_14_3_um_filter_36_18]